MASLAEMISGRAAKHPEKTAFVDLTKGTPRSVSYCGFYAGACRVAERLAGLGLSRGDKVVLMGGNSPEWGAACLGVHLAGLTLVPLDHETAAEGLHNILTFLKPGAAVCDRSLYPRFKDLEIPVIELESLDLSCGKSSFNPVAVPDDQPFTIVFTSGSTSVPKGVMLSEKNLLHNVGILLAAKGTISQSDRLLNLLPLHHVYPFTASLLTPLCCGATIIYPRSLKGEDIMAAARVERATILVAVPGVLQALRQRIFSSVQEQNLLSRSLFKFLFRIGSMGITWGFRPGRYLFPSLHRRMPNLRYIACGGARLDAELHRELAGLGFRILEAYGLSETAPIVSMNSLDRPMFGSAGRPVPGVEIKLLRPDPVLENQEVLVRGPNVMLGYLDQPEATRAAFIDNWFRTGDLGYLDPQANLFISGRLKEVIVMSSGKNIYPEELEKYYSRCELIEEVCICHLHEGRSEHLAAVVVPSREALKRKRSANVYEDIKFDLENLTVNLPSYQRITRLILAEKPFPRTRLGKLKRWEIMQALKEKEKKERIVSEKSAPVLEITGDPLLDFVRRTLKLEENPSGKENLELDLGLDSISKLDFLAAFENHFGVRVSDEEASTLIIVDELRLFLKRAPEAEADWKRKSAIPLEKLVELGEGWTGRIFRLSGHIVLKVLMKLLFRIHIQGAENCPSQGAYIIAPNHLSLLDGPMLHGALPFHANRRIFTLSLAEIFDHFPFSLLSYYGRILKTGSIDTTAQSLSHCAEILKKGYPLILFPEGKRSLDGKVDEPKPGMTMLAASCQVPIVPVHIHGTMALLSRKHPGFRLSRVRVEILPAIPPRADSKELSARWLELMREREHLVSA